MTRLLTVLVAGALVLPAAPALAGTAAPPDDPGVSEAEAVQNGNTRGVNLFNSQIRLSGSGLGEKGGGGYSMPRPCWYEPFEDAEAMLRRQEQGARRFDQFAGGGQTDVDGFLKQFRDKVGEPGQWWAPAMNLDAPGAGACYGALEPFIFVPPNETPPSGITLEQLAEVARAALTVPEPTIELNPDARSYVNLPTFVWLGGVGETTRSVTAAIPGLMTATVVATLGEIRIDPGTTADRAEVKEGCAGAGMPYRKGAAFTCGVRYLRASADQPRDAYTLTVTTQWPVQGQGAVAPFAFDPVQNQVTRDVPVGEVHSTVRGSGS